MYNLFFSFSLWCKVNKKTLNTKFFKCFFSFCGYFVVFQCSFAHDFATIYAIVHAACKLKPPVMASTSSTSPAKNSPL